jgi:thiamine pyrophosphokinase
MRAFIYTGGDIDPKNISESPSDEDVIIAADSGYRNARKLGVKPQILLGDFDSLPRDELNDAADGAEVITVPSQKDFTDTQLAVDTAIKKGAKEIIIIGGIDGRLDHTLSNLAIIESFKDKGVRGHITDGRNRVRYLQNDSIILMRSAYKYFSLIARSEKVKGVCIEGARYPLKGATLVGNYQYAISNEIEGNCAFISVKKGALLITESKD